METLHIKNEVTGVAAHFDAIYCSHSFGVPKEEQDFWRALDDAENFDPATTVFVDDTTRVLDSARAYGVSMLLEITHPDTSVPARDGSDHTGVGGLRDLL